MPKIIKWVKARCPECGGTFEYPEGGYKLATCANPDCIKKYLHPELKGRK